MKKILHVLFILALLMVVPGNGIAGVEPSPFKPEINKLNAVENNLRSIHERLNRVLGTPPDPFMPSPNVQGAVGRLAAMENQTLLLNSMVVSVMDEVLGAPPDPWVPTPTDLLPALAGVRDASQGISDSIMAYLSNPSDPWLPAAFISALTNVRIASQNIADDAVQYIMSGEGCIPGVWCGCSGTATSCNAFFDLTLCNAQAGCLWSFATDPAMCIGTPTACSGLDSSTCGSQSGCRNGICEGGTCQ